MTSKSLASIRTRYLPPTDKKGKQISVSSDSPFRRQRREFNWKEGKGIVENHRLAAQAWVDIEDKGATIVAPGLQFDFDFYWGWDF